MDTPDEEALAMRKQKILDFFNSLENNKKALDLFITQASLHGAIQRPRNKTAQ